MTDKPVIQALTKELVETRSKLRELAVTEKELKTAKTELEQRLIEAMDAVGTTGAKAEGHNLNINKTTVASWTDYDTFAHWLIEHVSDHPEYLALFERRISSVAFRELLKHVDDGKIPGLTPYERRTLSLTIQS